VSNYKACLHAYTVQVENISLILKWLAVVIGAVKLIVSLNEQYKGQGQPFLPIIYLTLSLLEDSIYIVTTKYRFNLITDISINIRITILN
jgi:hypothetical protein